MSTPFVAQVMIHYSFYLVVGVYATLIFLCVIAALALPIETKGKSLAVRILVFVPTGTGRLLQHCVTGLTS